MTHNRATPAQGAAAKLEIIDILAAEDWPDDAWPVAVHMIPWFYENRVLHWGAIVSAEQPSAVLNGRQRFSIQSDEYPALNQPRVADRIRAALADAIAKGVRRLEVSMQQVSAHERIAAEIKAARWDAPDSASP